jgi:hypothetical protein
VKIYYDTEFLEDGCTIDLISVGMVAEDGRELYAINADMPFHAIMHHEWLMANVMPHLPVKLHSGDGPDVMWDENHPDMASVEDRWDIAALVREFILATPRPELWAWYAAYDHVALCQLWGPMASLPKGVPMWTNDLKQEAQRLGNPDLPSMPGVSEHNALSDAREVKFRAEWLAGSVTP